MPRLLKILLPLFLLVALDVTAANQKQLPWPVKRQIDLSSGFGDLRPNRFHAGIDIRTGGQIGTKIYSPVNGYVWRIRMSYSGYGKGLYIIGDDGHIYVYGHLDNFSTKIDKVVKQAQVRSRRYYQDLTFEKTEIPIKQGEFIAFSGRTGSNAPHLHFEIRTPDNYPINPLNHGFSMHDAVRPVFSRIGFKMTDDHSLFDNGSRKLILDAVRQKTGSDFAVEKILRFNSPFGVLVDCYDQHRVGGMRHTPRKLSLYIDDTLYYQITMDTLDFDVQRSVNLEYDLVEAADGEKRVRRLFHRSGNEYSGSKPSNNYRGLFGGDGAASPGPHRGLVVAEDIAGNISRLTFDFVWESPNTALPLDSGTAVQRTTGDAALAYTVVDDGLIVYINAEVSSETTPRVELYDGDSLLGAEYPRLIAANRYACFITPQEKYRHINHIGYTLSESAPIEHFVTANIYLVGLDDKETIDVDGNFAVTTSRQNFFTPRFLDVRADENASGRYTIEPEAFVCKSDFAVTMPPRISSSGATNDGICWWDKKENEWVWLDNVLDGNRLKTAATGGGRYTLLTDKQPPVIGGLSVTNGLTYFNPQLSIDFLLSDDLSKFADDRDILIELDGQWMIPEYDPFTRVCKTKPLEPLADGRHDLKISVTDRAGNKTEKTLHFFVRAQK